MKTVLITGTSGGIGKETAKLFAERDWNVVATMRRPEMETELRRYSNVTILPLDVTNDASVAEAVGQTLQMFGAVDVLVNNAGYGAIGALEAVDYQDYFRQFDTNLFGVIRMIQAVLPSMRENKKGVIINISSVAEMLGSPFGSLYHGSKWAVSGLTESLQYELSEFNIHVKMVLPPPVRTNFFGKSMDVADNEKSVMYKEALGKSFWLNEGLLNRISLTPDKIAKIIYRAATDGKKKLRYNAGNGCFIRFFRRIFPDSLMFWFVRKTTMKT